MQKVSELFEGRESSLFKTFTEATNDPLKITRKYCFERCKAGYKGKKPFGVYWGTMTGHLKTLSDWTTARSIADQEEKRGKDWFITFIGSLKVQQWQK